MELKPDGPIMRFSDQISIMQKNSSTRMYRFLLDDKKLRHCLDNSILWDFFWTHQNGFFRKLNNVVAIGSNVLENGQSDLKISILSQSQWVDTVSMILAMHFFFYQSNDRLAGNPRKRPIATTGCFEKNPA